jgi:nucleoside transporter
MNVSLYIMLSIMMGLQYAIWGAWSPVLASRLLGPLKFNGKQTGWIYGTLPLACIVAPLLSGQLADKYVNTETILAVCHLAGAVLLFLAARQHTFGRLMAVMLGYAFCYAATLPLVNALMFTHVTEGTGINVGHVFMWAPIAWALVGYGLTGWRWKFKTGDKGVDCLYLGAALSLVMAGFCFFLPSTPPANQGTAPILDALSMLKQSNFLIFVVVSMAVAGMMQFYFLGTAPFLQSIGISNRNIPATMALAQAVQTVATFVALGLFTTQFGFKNTLLIGATCWSLMYGLYALARPRWLMVIAQSLHGLAYVFFIIAGQMLANTLASPEMRSSMQALIFAATTGIGLFLGTQLAGSVMDRFKKEEDFQWSKIFVVPCVIILAVTLVFWLLFK